MHHEFSPSGVCSTRIAFDLEGGKLKNVAFKNGCDGNLKAISRLAEGRNADEVAELLLGNTCGFKSTSCADQFAQAISKAIAEDAAAH